VQDEIVIVLYRMQCRVAEMRCDAKPKFIGPIVYIDSLWLQTKVIGGSND